MHMLAKLCIDMSLHALAAIQHMYMKQQAKLYIKMSNFVKNEADFH